MKGCIITVSGISGAGKSYFIKNAILDNNDFERLIAVTTREPRDGEIEGIDKFFLGFDEFNDLCKRNQLVAINNVFGNMNAYYRADIEKCMQGINLIAELHYRGIQEFKQSYPETVSIYILPKDIRITLRELYRRNMSQIETEARLKDMFFELECIATEVGKKDFNRVFYNEYNERSLDDFRHYIRNLL